MYGNQAKTYLCRLGDGERVGSLCLVFLANYLGVKQSNPDELISLYRSILPSMTIGNIPVFSDVGTNAPAALNLGEVDIASYRFPGAASTFQLGTCAMTKQNVKAFWTEMTSLFNAEGVSMMNMINLTCFIMLNCLRLIKKESTCLNSHMPESGTHSFQSLYQGWLKLTIPPPGGNFPIYFQNTFPGNDLDSKQIFACLVNGWIAHSDNHNYLGLLKAGGMLSLADNGLGLISWTVKAAEKMGVELGTYMTAVLVNQALIASMRRILDFINQNTNQKTWPWCRLFEESALFDYSTKKNKDATVLSALVVMGDESALSQMAQFKEMDVHIRRYSPIASSVIEHFAGLTSGVVGSEEARSIMMTAMSMPNEPSQRLVRRHVSPQRPLTPISSIEGDEEDDLGD